MNYQATDKLSLNANVSYNKAEDSWDWEFGNRPSLMWTGTALVTTSTNEQTAYDTSDQNNVIDEYSDLSYEQYQVTVGGTYQFTDALYTTASLTYDIFNSDEEFVYGDEDGKAFYSYLGVGYRF